MTASLRITPFHASPGKHVNVACRQCRRRIGFFLRGGVNLLECYHCHELTGIEVVHNGGGWEARKAGL